MSNLGGSLTTARNRRANPCRQSGSRDDRHDGAQHHKAQKDAAESRRRADAGGHAGSLAGHHTHDRLLSVAIQEASTAAEDNHAENEERPPVACRTPGGDEVTKRGNRKSARSRIGRAWLVSAARNPMNAAKPPAKPASAEVDSQPCAWPWIKPQVRPNIEAAKRMIPPGSRVRASLSRDSWISRRTAVPNSAQTGTLI